MSEPYVPQVGHRVRLSTTGVVSDVTDGFTLLKGGGGYATPRYEWTRLPDPEPDWEPGDIVIDADGDVFVRATDHKYPWVAGSESFECDVPTRPLTRLVRETHA